MLAPPLAGGAPRLNAMIKLKYITVISTVGVIAGIAGIAPVLLQQVSISSAVAKAASTPAIETVAATPPTSAPAALSGHPTHISIPYVGIELNVIDGFYNQKDGSWTLSDHNVQFATITPEPNDKTGNTFIYGHATNEVFGHLPRIKKDAEVAITTTNGYRFVYKFRDSVVVSPTDTSVLAATQSSTLTLQTCTGFWSENRQIFHFDFVRVEKI